jgi:hypothetical protein
MAQAYSKYNGGVGYVVAGKNVDFAADTFAFVLSNTAPNVTTATYSVGNVTELATLSSCYTQGTGIAITTGTNTNTGGVYTWVYSTIALLTNSNAGNFGPFSYVILYDKTSPFPLFGWWQTIAAIQMAPTDTFQVSFASSQILQWS